MADNKEALFNAFKAYKVKFGEPFPTIPGYWKDDADLIEQINGYIERGVPKDPYDNGRIPKYVKF